MFACSVFMCAVLIRNQWLKWESSPMMVSFAESATPIWEIPFPAVTICSETKFRQTLYNFTELHELHNKSRLSPDEKTEFESVSMVCKKNLFKGGSKTVKAESLTLLEEVSQPLDEMIASFIFKGKKVGSPEEKFVPLLTDEGVCYTFNMLNHWEIFTPEVENYGEKHLNSDKHSTWSMEDGYTTESGVKISYPRRALGSGINAGFTISLETRNIDLDYLCRGPVQGFKIILHNPGELPRVSNQYFRAPLNQEMTVGVKPTMFTTSEGLRGYSPDRRQCFFPMERQLRYFLTYTQSNCNMECVTNYTRRQCNCVSLSMPRAHGVELCGPGSRECMTKAEASMVMGEAMESWQQGHQPSLPDGTRPRGDGTQLGCDCKPACTELQYDSQTSQADYAEQKNYALEYGIEEGDPLSFSSTTVSIFMKESQIITNRRSELFGRTDFLANCGGLLGLFMGFSVLSLAEIVYHCSINTIYKLVKWLASKGKVKEEQKKEVNGPVPEYVTIIA